MFESKLIAHLACTYLFFIGCLCFKIQKDSAKTEYMVKEFLQERNKSWFVKAPWKPSSTVGYVCSHSSRFLAYLCAVILQQDPYHEIIDSARHRLTICSKHYIDFSTVGNIRQKESNQIRLYDCPAINGYGSYKNIYYLSRTHIKSSVFIYVSNDHGLHVYPDAFVSDIDMRAIKKKYKKTKVLQKKRKTIRNKNKITATPRPAEVQQRSLINERMILLFSESPLRKAALFQYLNFQKQKWTYKKFQIHYNKISVCSLRLQQQIYMCKQVLHNGHTGFEMDLTYYRKNICRKRRILNKTWQIVDPISTLMCPPIYSKEKRGLERAYKGESYFLSAGPDETSVVIFERSYNEHYIKPIRLVSAFNTNVLVEILNAEKSQPRNDPSNVESDTEAQFSLSATSSPDEQSTSLSSFSSSPDSKSSHSTSSRTSSLGRSSQFSSRGKSFSSRSQSLTSLSGITSFKRTSSLLPSYRPKFFNKGPSFREVHVNHDRYVAEKETVEFSQIKSIKYPYERFRLTHAKNSICNMKANLQVQLCKEILEGSEFSYQLVTESSETPFCQLQNIAVNLQDSEDLFSNKVSLLQCPNVQAYDSVYYLSSSRQDKSAILFRKLSMLELIYPEAYISYVDEEVLEQKTSLKIKQPSLKRYLSSSIPS